jgi:hypothetical protein
VLPVFSQVQTIANLPGVSLTTDFLKMDGQLLLATTDGAQIQVFNVANGLKPIASGAPGYPVRILSLNWWAPGNGRGVYLAVNVWSDRDKKQQGALFLLDADTLKPVAANIPRILGAFDLDGDRRPETLLGQEFSGENFFGRSISVLKLAGAEIRYAAPGLKLPLRFTVLGSALADVTGDGQPEAIYIRNRILYVYSGREMLYKSPKQMGGSLSFLTYDIDPEFKDGQPATVELQISPAIADVDNDGSPEILAVASDRNLLGGLGITPGIEKSWVAVFRHHQGRFESGRLGDALDKPLQGLAADENRILLVATEPGNLTGEGANSHLLAFSLSP